MRACLQREDKYSFVALKRSLAKKSNKSKRLRLFLAMANAQSKGNLCVRKSVKAQLPRARRKVRCIVWDSSSKGSGKADVSGLDVRNRKACERRGVSEIPGEPVQGRGTGRKGKGSNKEARVPSRDRHATHAKRISTQVFREFAMPALHNNDLRLSNVKCVIRLRTRNETFRRNFL